MRKLSIMLVTAAFGLAVPAISVAAPVGPPQSSTSFDSGRAGNNWATDTYKRQFSVTANADGSYTVLEHYISGKFVTIEGPSPEGTGHIVGGVTGSFQGYIDIQVAPGVTYNGSNLDYTSTDAWLKSAFGTSVYYTEPDWSFTYHANGPGLVSREWTDALSGDSGDIASS